MLSYLSKNNLSRLKLYGDVSSNILIGDGGIQSCLIQQLGDITRFPFLFTVLFFHLHWLHPHICLLLDHKISAEVPAITFKTAFKGKKGLFLSVSLSYE